MPTEALHAAAVRGDPDAVEALLAGGADPTAPGPLRVWVARTAPSPVDQGGGTLRVDVSVLAPARLLLRLDGDYRGALPAADPPWTLHAEVEVTVDDDGHVLTQHRRHWTTS